MFSINKFALKAVFIVSGLACQLFGSLEESTLRQLPFYPKSLSRSSVPSEYPSQTPVWQNNMQIPLREASLGSPLSEVASYFVLQQDQAKHSSCRSSLVRSKSKPSIANIASNADLMKNSSSQTPILAVSQKNRHMSLKEASLGSPLFEVRSCTKGEKDALAYPSVPQRVTSPLVSDYVIQIKNSSKLFVTLESVEVRKKSNPNDENIPCETFWTDSENSNTKTKRTSFTFNVEQLGVKDKLCFSGLLVCLPQKNDDVVIEIDKNGMIQRFQNCSISRHK